MHVYRSVVTGLIFAILIISSSFAHAASWNYRIGEQAPPVELKTLQGKPVSSSADWRGHFVVLSFMTSWCPFCNAAAPYFEQLGHTYEAKGVRAVIVDVDELEQAGSVHRFANIGNRCALTIFS